MKLKLTNILLILLCSVVFCSCEEKPKTLPILGPREAVEKTENGKAVTDTIYHTIPDFSFTDQDSTKVTQETLEGKIYVADFFFTTCPTICPVMKSQMLRVYEKYDKNNDVAILSHTIDPAHDSVAVLKDFSERLGVNSSRWHFVTGAKDSIYKIAQSYLVSALEDKDAPGGFIHSGAFILVDKQRRIRGYYDGTDEEKVTKLISDIEVLLNEK